LKQWKDEAKLNKTEKAYLAHARASRLYSWIGVQNVTLKLGDDCRFTPDFALITAQTGQFYFVDVKGFQRDDALVKIKTAARMFPWATFLIVKKDKTSWKQTTISP